MYQEGENVPKDYDIIVVRTCAVGFCSEHEVVISCSDPPCLFFNLFFCHGVNKTFRAIIRVNTNLEEKSWFSA